MNQLLERPRHEENEQVEQQDAPVRRRRRGRQRRVNQQPQRLQQEDNEQVDGPAHVHDPLQIQNGPVRRVIDDSASDDDFNLEFLQPEVDGLLVNEEIDSPDEMDELVMENRERIGRPEVVLHNICVICRFRRINCASHCGHSSCRECMDTYIDVSRATHVQNNRREEFTLEFLSCPQCRQPMGGVIPLFL